jgi:hypothetical protein
VKVRVKRSATITLGGYAQTLTPGQVYNLPPDVTRALPAGSFEPVVTEPKDTFSEDNFLQFALGAVTTVKTPERGSMQLLMLSRSAHSSERSRTLKQLEILGFDNWVTYDLEHADSAASAQNVIVYGNETSLKDNRRHALTALEIARHHHQDVLLLGDDLEVSPTLLTWLELAGYLDTVVSFSNSRRSNHPGEIERAAYAQEAITPQLVDAKTLENFHGASCVYIPKRLVPVLLDAEQPESNLPFDLFLGRTLAELGEPIKLAVPNPVNTRPDPSLTYSLNTQDVEALAKVPVLVNVLEKTLVPSGVYTVTLAKGTRQLLPYGVARRLVEQGKVAKVVTDAPAPSAPSTPPTPEPVAEETAPLPAQPIAETDLPHQEELAAAGITDFQDLPNTEDGLVALKGIGKVKAQAILEWLND